MTRFETSVKMLMISVHNDAVVVGVELSSTDNTALVVVCFLSI